MQIEKSNSNNKIVTQFKTLYSTYLLLTVTDKEANWTSYLQYMNCCTVKLPQFAYNVSWLLIVLVAWISLNRSGCFLINIYLVHTNSCEHFILFVCFCVFYASHRLLDVCLFIHPLLGVSRRQSDCTGYEHELHRNVAPCKYVIAVMLR